MKKIMFILALGFLASCSSPSRNDINSIKLLEKKDLDKCQAIDAVEGTNDKGVESLAIEMAKAKVYKLDANALFIQENVANGSNIKIMGTAYQCK